MTKCRNGKTEIAVLKEQMDETKEFVKDMKNNHLPHIYDTLNKININLAKVGIWDKLKSIALVISSGIIGAMAAYIFLN